MAEILHADTLLHDSQTLRLAVGSRWGLLSDPDRKNLLKFFFINFNSYFALSAYPDSAEANAGWGGNLNVRLMASCVRNTRAKNY